MEYRVHFADPKFFESYHNEVILAMNEHPRKQLLLIINARTGGNKNITLVNSYFVKNKFDQIIYTGDHLKPAIKVYNKL